MGDADSRMLLVTQYDRLDRLKVASLQVGDIDASRNWGCDKTGNIKSVDGQRYQYNPDLAHQLLNTPQFPGSFKCDDNGNIERNGGSDYQWSSFNKPVKLTDSVQTAQFTYGANRGRINKVLRKEGLIQKSIAYFGGYQKINDLITGVIEHKYHISAGGGLIAVHSVKENGSGQAPVTQPVTTNYLHTDALGSVSLITDVNGHKVDRLAYTPFGARRNVSAIESFANPVSLTLTKFDPVITKRGYTGHEHIDELDLIHMNGRVYDPAVGRFLSPDPHVQMPQSTQGFNRYA